MSYADNPLIATDTCEAVRGVHEPAEAAVTFSTFRPDDAAEYGGRT